MRTRTLLVVLALAAPTQLIAAPPAAAMSSDIVISQVYGGGGNAGATLRNDFIELFNRGSAPVTVDGWSVQYASAAGSTWQRTILGGTIPPGAYYLVQQAAGAAGTTNLPAPDATGTIPMSATSGKVALVTTSTLLTGSAPTGPIKDLVGYGTADFYEGSGAAPGLTNTTAALRLDGGCMDTDVNAWDLLVAAPSPRNLSSPAHTCATATAVISQIYGGGGNAGSVLTHDFIELFNAGAGPVDVSGWTVQYASASGTTWQRTSLNGVIPPGGYYLVQQAAGAVGTTPLPAPDAAGSIAMSATSGKVALVDGTAPLTGTAPSGTIDFVGYGSANAFEGSGPAPGLNNTTAALRKRAGCVYTGDNLADFVTGAPHPRNSSSPRVACGSVDEPVARAGGPYSVAEGGSVTLDGTGSTHPDGDDLVLSWDLDGDGTLETSGATPTFSAVGLDGPSTHVVRLLACHDLGGCDSDTAVVTVENVAPDVYAGPDVTVYRNDVVALTGSWTDPAGQLDEPYEWEWQAAGLATRGSSWYGALATASTSFADEGDYTVALAVADDDGDEGLDTAVVTVLNRAPDCSAATPTVGSIDPPNHRFVGVGIGGLTDAEGDALTVLVDSVRQDEAVREPGSGATGPDAMGVGTSTALLRAERSGIGDGRVYHVGFSADDGHGGRCTGTVKVAVPHDRRGGGAGDQGPLFDSTVE